MRQRALVVAAVPLVALLTWLWRRRGDEFAYGCLYGGLSVLVFLALVAEAVSGPGAFPQEFTLGFGAVLTVLDGLLVLSVRNLVAKTRIPVMLSLGGLFTSIVLGCLFAVAGLIW